MRLILGRTASNAREWETSLLWLGRDVDDLVQSYLRSIEFSRRGFNEKAVPSAVEMADYDGFSIYAARDDVATGRAILAGRYEPHVAAVFRRCLRPGMTVIDVGANVGYFSMLAASLVGAAGSVTAVEPNPDNVRLLEASRRLNRFDQVRVACVAAGREMGVLQLKSDASNGVTVKLRGEDELWSSRLTPCLPLRMLLPEDRPVDFIKIDVEGAEYDALAGCADRLRRDRPVIVSEFSPDALPNISGVDGETYLRLLTSCGLGLGVIPHEGEIVSFGDDIDGVMDVWRGRTGHLDIIAAPET
jgi:FkbM family methyltransferase